MQCTFWASNMLSMPAGSFLWWTFSISKLRWKHKIEKCIPHFGYCILTLDYWLQQGLYQIHIVWPSSITLPSHRVSLLNCDTGRCQRQFHSIWNHQCIPWTHYKEALKEKMIFAFLTEPDFLNPRWCKR